MADAHIVDMLMVHFSCCYSRFIFESSILPPLDECRRNINDAGFQILLVSFDTTRVCASVKDNSPAIPPSRPMPECLNPPKGAPGAPPMCLMGF